MDPVALGLKRRLQGEAVSRMLRGASAGLDADAAKLDAQISQPMKRLCGHGGSSSLVETMVRAALQQQQAASQAAQQFAALLGAGPAAAPPVAAAAAALPAFAAAAAVAAAAAQQRAAVQAQAESAVAAMMANADEVIRAWGVTNPATAAALRERMRERLLLRARGAGPAAAAAGQPRSHVSVAVAAAEAVRPSAAAIAPPRLRLSPSPPRSPVARQEPQPEPWGHEQQHTAADTGSPSCSTATTKGVSAATGENAPADEEAAVAEQLLLLAGPSAAAESATAAAATGSALVRVDADGTGTVSQLAAAQRPTLGQLMRSAPPAGGSAAAAAAAAGGADLGRSPPPLGLGELRRTASNTGSGQPQVFRRRLYARTSKLLSAPKSRLSNGPQGGGAAPQAQPLLHVSARRAASAAAGASAGPLRGSLGHGDAFAPEQHPGGPAMAPHPALPLQLQCPHPALPAQLQDALQLAKLAPAAAAVPAASDPPPGLAQAAYAEPLALLPGQPRVLHRTDSNSESAAGSTSSKVTLQLEAQQQPPATQLDSAQQQPTVPLSPPRSPPLPAVASVDCDAEPCAPAASGGAAAQPAAAAPSAAAAQAALMRACKARLALQALLDEDASCTALQGGPFLPTGVSACLGQATLLLDRHLLCVIGGPTAGAAGTGGQ